MDRRVLLIVGGGIAAYKALELVRLYRKAGLQVRAVMTRAAAEFVTPLSLSTLTEDKVFSELFSLTDEQEIGHIELSRQADIVVVAPATSNLMGKAAQGLADDLASTVLMATDKPVLMAPAMNVRMWLHPATRRNLQTLIGDGVLIVGPDEGTMACGEFGPGRMAEPEAILQATLHALDGPAARPLKGKRVLVTAGPTFEPIDPVRGLTNRSSGKQGYAIAEALARLGAEVTLVSGPTALSPPLAARRVSVQTAEEMLRACEAAMPADARCWSPPWRTGGRRRSPLPRSRRARVGRPRSAWWRTPTSLRPCRGPGPSGRGWWWASPPRPDALEEHARAKLERKGCDWILANDVGEPGVLGGEEKHRHPDHARGVGALGAGHQAGRGREAGAPHRRGSGRRVRRLRGRTVASFRSELDPRLTTPILRTGPGPSDGEPFAVMSDPSPAAWHLEDRGGQTLPTDQRQRSSP
jgi:phosphopantothenoylcysteine decarboxylase/phosphopantothenate--cysteine ligase